MWNKPEIHFSVNSALQLMREQLIDIAKLQINVGFSCEMRSILSDRLLDLAEAEMEFSQSALQGAEASLEGLLQQITQAIADVSQMEFPAEIPNSALKSLQELTPLVPEEKREEFAEIVATAPEEKGRIFSKDNFWSIISVILAIISIFLSLREQTMSEESKGFLRDENGRQISAIEENTELTRREVEALEHIYDFLHELNDLSVGLDIGEDEAGDGLNPIGENIDDIEDFVVSDGQDDNTDTQTETQNLQQ